MKAITFTNDEIGKLRYIVDSYIAYLLASGVDEDHDEVRSCELIYKKL